MKNSSKISNSVRCCLLNMLVCSIILLAKVAVSAAEFTGKTFSSSNILITTLVCDQNYLWAGTNGQGLLKIDKKTGETVFCTMGEIDRPDCSIRSLALDKDGSLLVGTSTVGIVRYDGVKWTLIDGLPDKNVRAIVVDNKGKMWVWFQTAGVGSFDGTTWQTYVNRFSGVLTGSAGGDIWMMNLPLDGASNCNDGWIHEYVNSGLQSTISLAPVCNELTYPQSLCIDTKKTCWIGTNEQLIKINSASVNRYPFPAGKSLTAIAATTDKIFFSLADYSGTCDIYVYDQINSTKAPLDEKLFSFNSKYITAVCKDPASGGFWCATYDGKIICIDAQNKYSFFTTGNSVLPSNSITSLIADKTDKLWVGTNRGIAQYDNSKWTTWTSTLDTLPGLDVSTLSMDSSGTLWAGFRQSPISSSVNSGIASYISDHWHIMKRDYISVKKIAFDNSGTQWIVSEDGVFRNNQQTLERVFQTLYSSDAKIALGTTVNTIAFDKNNIPWIGTGLGLKRFENETWIDDTTINKYLPQNGLLKNGVPVNAICFVNNTTWIGTSYGLFKISDGTCLRIDTTGAILPDLAVQCIFAESADNVWIGTKKGLVHIDGTSHFTYTSNNTLLYDNDITACVKTSMGEIWAGTHLGGLTLITNNGSVIPTSVYSHYPSGKQSVTMSIHQNNGISIILNCSRPGRIDISIVALDGKLISHYSKVSSGLEPVTFNWNRVDKKGSPVAQNIYYGIISLNGNIIDRRMIFR